MNWDQYFMSMTYLVSMKSKDPSTRIGAVIVGPDHEIRSTGYNGLPRGLDDDQPQRSERPEKLFWYEHGERNAIYNAARMGIALKDCTMYTQGVPCADCARAVIQAGIRRVIVDKRIEMEKDVGGSKWSESCKRSRVMFEEAGVELVEYAGPITTEIQGLRGGSHIPLSEERAYPSPKQMERV